MSEAPSKRRVRFAANHECFEYERDLHDSADFWITKESCYHNKERCIRSARHWKRKGYDVLLNDSYQKPTLSTQSKLNAFAQIEPEQGCIPRGIERFISSKHADERRSVKIYCIEAVVDLCTYMKRQGKTMAEMEDDLRELSLEHSRPSQSFAARVGFADALAVQGEKKEHGDDETKSVISTTSTTSTRSKFGLSSRAILGTKRITRMITGKGSSR